MRVRVPILSLAVLVLAGCDAERCGLNTHEENGACLGNAAIPCGPGTVLLYGRCVVPDAPPCGPGTVWDATAGQCVPDGLCPTTETRRGARWNSVLLVQPEAIADIANLQLPAYFADGTIVVILETESGAPEFRLHGGTGAKLAADPLTYGFADGFRVGGGTGPVTAVREAPDASGAIPFHTAAPFDWTFVFLPGQPPLDVRHVGLTGTLTSDGLATSSEPPLRGRYTGCFTAASAEALYIEVLGKPLKGLLDANGAPLDADCTGAGVLDGYVLELQWEATEIVALGN
ncbi:MAG TPA: hypothetical protein VGQ83_32310 [Polyangia bacterium]|jgi:hypothetical protein